MLGKHAIIIMSHGLNPYSNGRYSMSLNNIKFSFLNGYNAYKSKRPAILLKKRSFLKGCKVTNKNQYVKERFC